MSLAYSATANATAYATSISTSSGISVTTGDLIVIGWGGLDSTRDPTTCSDSLGNTYTVRDVRDSTNDSTLRIGWCVSAFTGSATFTGNMVDTASQRCYITVITFTVDSGDTISVDSYGTLTAGWTDSPFLTSEFTISGTDCVAVAFICAISPQTYSNHEIPDGTAASTVTSGYGSQASFYQLITSTGSGVEAAVNSTSSSGIAAECVVFKSTASAGAESLASTVNSSSSVTAMVNRILYPRTSVTSASTISNTPMYRFRYYANAVTSAASTLWGNLTELAGNIIEELSAIISAASSVTGNIYRRIYHAVVVTPISTIAGSLTKLSGAIGDRFRIYMRIGRGRF